MDLQENKGGIPSKQAIYQKAAAHAYEAIETLARIIKDGDNDNARVGAAKALLAKCIPDLKASELTGKDGEPLLQALVKFLDGNDNSRNPQ